MDITYKKPIQRKPVPSPLFFDNGSYEPLTLSRKLQQSLVSPRNSFITPTTQTISPFHLSGILELPSPLRTPQTPASPPISAPTSPLGSPVSPPAALQSNRPGTPNVDPSVPPEIPKMSSYRITRGVMQSILANGASAEKPKPTALPNLPRFDDLINMKTTCALCQDPNMLVLNGMKVDCGHCVHRSCFSELRSSLYDNLPTCSLCGFDLQRSANILHRDDSDSDSETCFSPSLDSKSSASSGDIASFGDALLTDDCDVEPLQARCFIQASSATTCDVSIRVSCSRAIHKSLWKHHNTITETDKLNRISASVLKLVPMPGKLWKDKLDACGKLRLVSTFLDDSMHAITGHLFEKCIVLISLSSQKVEQFHSLIDVNKDTLDIFCEDENYVVLHDRYDGFISHTTPDKKKPPLKLKSDRKTVVTWLAAINDKTLGFAVDEVPGKLMESPVSAGYVESNKLELVLCIPVSMVSSIVSRIVPGMNPQDTLGLVVSGPDGTHAWIVPHKSTWPHWKHLREITMESYTLFTEATEPVLETAGKILSTPHQGKQQCVIVTAGCPLLTTTLEMNWKKQKFGPVSLYAIGFGNYNLAQLTQLGTDTSDEKCRFYHASSPSEVVSNISAIAASEKHYRHHHIKVRVSPSSIAHITGYIGQPPQFVHQDMDGSIEMSLGSLMAGQSKTVLIQLEFNSLPNTDLRDLVKRSISSNSAATLNPYVNDCLSTRQFSPEYAPQIFFDKTSRLLAEKLFQCQFLPVKTLQHELESQANAMFTEIQKVTNQSRKIQSLGGDSNVLMDLYDPVFSDESMLTRAKHLAWGLRQFQRDMAKLSTDDCGFHGKLVETVQTLDTQISVMCRNDLERIYFEGLPINVI